MDVLQNVRLDYELQTEKLQRLEKEMEEMSTVGNKDDREVGGLQKIMFFNFELKSHQTPCCGGKGWVSIKTIVEIKKCDEYLATHTHKKLNAVETRKGREQSMKRPFSVKGGKKTPYKSYQYEPY